MRQCLGLAGVLGARWMLPVGARWTVQCHVQCALALWAGTIGDKNRRNGHTVLAILFASDFKLTGVVSVDPSLDPGMSYVQLLGESPARSRLQDNEE